MMGRSGLPVVLLLLTLSGCAGIVGPETVSDETAPEEAASESVSASPSTQDSVPAPAPQRRPASEAATEAPADASVEVSPPEAGPETTESDLPSGALDREGAEVATAQKMPDFDRLMGLAFGAVEELLGPADAKLDVPPARNWVYRAGHCRLVISFYPDLEALDYRVLSYRVEVEDQGTGYDDNAALEGCENIFRERLHLADSSDG